MVYKELVGWLQPEDCRLRLHVQVEGSDSGVSWESILGFFDVFINDTDTRIECTLSNFVDERRTKGWQGMCRGTWTGLKSDPLELSEVQ